MKSDLAELIRRLDQGWEVSPEELPRLVTLIASELGPLIRLAGAAAATVLRTRGSFLGSSTTLGREAESIHRLALRVTEAANMLGLSRSSIYEMIGKRQIGVVRLGSRSIRIPTKEVERLLTESLVPPLFRG